jgi:hypothetical protein
VRNFFWDEKGERTKLIKNNCFWQNQQANIKQERERKKRAGGGKELRKSH